MKKLFTFLAACLILALPASSAVYKKTLISETFALCTQGSIETPTTENIYDAATGEIFSQYLTTPGWHFVTQTGEVSTNALTQAGGVAYVESSYNAMLQSPTLKWGGSTDGQVTVTFDALPVGETTSIRFDLRTSASGKKQVAAEFTAGEWSTVSVTHSISGDEGTIRLNGGEAFYIRNLVVTINAEAPDLSGTYDFASTVSVVNEGTWSDLAVANFTFDVEANTGEDAEQYPYIVKNFLPFNMATGNAPHDLKAFYGPDGNLVIQGGCNAAHYLYGESNEQYHLCLFDGKGYAGGNGQIALSKTAEGYTVADGITAVRHSKYDWGFMSDDTPIDLVRYSDIAITRPKVVGYDEFVGTYNITGTRNAESLVDLSRPKGWKVLDGEGTFDIELNTGDDAEQFPLILKGFLGTPDFAVNDLKARVVNGKLSVPQGKNISLQGSSPRAFLCTTTEETSTYTATEDDIIFTADAEGKLVPNATVAVGYHEDGISFLGIPDDDRVAYIYSSLVIAPKTSPEVEPNTTTMYFTAPELRDEVANIGQALIGVLNVTTTADKYVTETLRSSEASADGTLAGVRAPQEEEVFEVLAVEGGYVLRHHNAAEGEGYLGLNGNTFTAADQAGATVWTILGPDEEGYGSVTSFDDIYPDIAAELNPNMVRFITQGQYLNGQNFENIGGIRGGTGAWSFNYVRNANYVEVVDYRPALAEAITAGEEALAAHELSEPLVTIKSDGLITTADQFSSDFSDSAEGTDFGALIDEEPSTFWHSDWHDAAPEGPHSFDVNIPENTFTSFDVIYAGRFGANNCSPIVMTVYGKNEGGEWETITTLTQEDGLGAYAGQGHSKNIEDIVGEFVFSTTKVYTDFRFEAHAIWADAGVWTDLEDFEMPEGAEVNEERCFNYSEFQMYGAELKKYDIEEELALALEAAVAEGKTLYNDETVADTDAQLQTATEAINAALKAVEEAEVIVFDYVIRIVGAEDGAAIIGGEEWYDGEELTTVYAKVTAEDVTALEVEGYEATVTVEDGVITVTYTLATGIDGLSTDAQRAAIFNIQGQRLNAVGRGVNVVGGKKVLVK